MTTSICFPILVISSEGKVREFYDLESIGKKLSILYSIPYYHSIFINYGRFLFEGKTTGTYFDANKTLANRLLHRYPYDHQNVKGIEYIIRDDSGKIIKDEVLQEAVNKVRGKKKKLANDGYVRRNGPVSGIGKHGGYGNYLRYPKTLAENRAILGIEDDLKEYKEEYGSAINNIRIRNMLPTVWDDIPRFNEKSWKSFRKTQYKTGGC